MAGSTGGGAIVSAQEAPTIIVGSDDFYESVLAAEIYAQALEAQRLHGRPGRPRHRGSDRLAWRPSNRARSTSCRSTSASGSEYYTQDPEAIRSRGCHRDERGRRDRCAEPAGRLRAHRHRCHGARRERRPGHQRRGRPSGYGRSSSGWPAMSDLAAVQDELRFGLPPGVRDQPALPRRARALRHLLAARAARAPAALRRGDGRRPRGRRHRRRPGSARRSRSSPRTAGSCSRTTSRRSRRATSCRSCATTCSGRSRVAPTRWRPSSTPSRRQLTTEVLTELGVRIAVDQEDVEDVAADFLASPRALAAAVASPAALALPADRPRRSKARRPAAPGASRPGAVLRDPGSEAPIGRASARLAVCSARSASGVSAGFRKRSCSTTSQPS